MLELEQAEQAMEEGDYPRARALIGALLAESPEPVRALALGLGARHAMDCGEDEAARGLLAEHELLVAQVFGPLSPQAGEAWALRARFHRLEGRPERAVEASGRALRLLEGQARAGCRLLLAEALLELGQAEEAAPVLIEARREANPAQLAQAEPLQARAALAMGQPRLAIGHAHAAIERSHALHGPDSPAFADAMLLLAAAYQAEGDMESALAAADRAVAVLGRALGPEHPEVGLAAAWMLTLQEGV